MSQIFGVILKMSNIILLAGLSESGKSEAGEYLGGKDGVERIKFVRVVVYPELLKNPLINPYTRMRCFSQQEISKKFWKNFMDYFYKSKEKDIYVVESVLSPEAILNIKRNVDSRFNVQTIYFDVSIDKRIERQMIKERSEGKEISRDEATFMIVSRDKNKLSLGADRIKRIADVVINNEGGLKEFHENLDIVYENLIIKYL